MYKMICSLLLLIVVIGFSGIGYAVTELVSPAYNESVLVEEAWNETIPEVNETIFHPEVNHTEQVLISNASEEKVFDHYLVHGQYTLKNGTSVSYYGNGPYFNPFPYWPDINKWSDFIYSHPGATSGCGSWVAYYNITLIPAVYEDVFVIDVPAWEEFKIISPEQIIFHDAIYDIIFHDAIYRDVPDPVTPIVDPVTPIVNPVTPIVEVEETIPMQETGGDFTIIAAALVAIIGGILIARRE